MPRRPRNPSGFVRPRENKSGRSWQGIVQYPDPDRPGVWKQRSSTFERKAEAQAWVDTTRKEHRDKPEYRPPTEETFGDYMERWLRDICPLRVRRTTMESHRQMAKHSIKAFGHKPLAALRADDFQTLYATMLSAKYATATIRYVHAVARKALQDAVEMDLLPANPADRAKKPRVVQKEIIPPSLEQARALLQSLEQDRLRGLWWFIALTGCRRGEALGLRWEDINFAGSTVTIRRTLTGNGSRRHLQEPKTARSKRTMAMSSLLTAALLKHRETQALERLAAEPNWQDSGFVFTTRVGGWLDPSWARRQFKDVCRVVGLPQTTRIHDLRHSLATTWLAHGIPIQVVSERLGHSSISVTLALYAHVLPNQQAAATEAIDALMVGGVSISSARAPGNDDKP